jgi:hypothetical protein
LPSIGHVHTSVARIFRVCAFAVIGRRGGVIVLLLIACCYFLPVLCKPASAKVSIRACGLLWSD